MREITGQELKNIELQILCEVHKFCADNDITYYLCGGTLLGAVRHGGFIPWDDDIDIYMPRKDYEKFLEFFSSNENYYALSYKNTDGYHLPFAKVCDRRTIVHETIVKDIPGCGVYIDVFPLDGLSDDIKISRRIHRKNNIYMLLLGIKSAYPARIDSIKSLAKRMIYLLCSTKRILRKIEHMSTKYSYDNSKYVGVAFGFYGEKETLEKEIFGDPVSISFEGYDFFAPQNADKYLTALYGNYMKLPPLEKRVSHHSFRAFWKG